MIGNFNYAVYDLSGVLPQSPKNSALAQRDTTLSANTTIGKIFQTGHK